MYDAFGKLVAEYGVGSPSLSVGSGSTSVKYIQQDWQGSVRAVTNNNGFVVARTDHQAFGEDIGIAVGLRKVEQGYSADGRTAINALEQAIERRRSADPNTYDGSENLLTTFLNGFMGRTVKDGLIRSTLKEAHKIQISDEELLRFIEFLIVLDPSYPSWTKVVVWGEMAPKESDRYFSSVSQV